MSIISRKILQVHLYAQTSLTDIRQMWVNIFWGIVSQVTSMAKLISV